MAAVVANGPIGINLSSGFYLIPLTQLDVSDSGEVTADLWVESIAQDVTVTTEDRDRINARLQALVESGVLRLTREPAPIRAMIITAAQAGPVGEERTIEVEFANVDAAATPPTADATVTEIDTYEGLTPTTVEQVLGGAPGAGTSPGLVYVTDVDTNKVPKNDSYSLTGNPAEAVVTAPGAGPPTAFKVKASKSGDEGEQIVVEIKDVDTAAKTFTLVATWTKEKPGVKVDTVDELNAEFDYLITVQPPTGETTPLPPAAGKTLLRGGAAAQPATPAKATIMSST